MCEDHSKFETFIWSDVDLLRCSCGREMIKGMLKEGKLVPSEILVKLLVKAMEENTNNKFLIDGFPRNDENREVFERVVCLFYAITQLFLYVDSARTYYISNPSLLESKGTCGPLLDHERIKNIGSFELVLATFSVTSSGHISKAERCREAN